MTKPVKNIAASVRQRLQNTARDSGRLFQELLESYTMERFLYRLARSPHAGRFVLKGALMFRTWGGAATRPTRDIDLLARMENTVEAVTPIFRDVCGVAVEPDGIVFDAQSVSGTVIKEDADYSGVRVNFLASLENARIAMQVDLGFADVITPGPMQMVYPVILDFPAPQLAGYPRETVVAEKFEAMVKLGALNSRMKDFYDLWILAHHFDFEGPTLASAVTRTFANRKTALAPEPLALTPAFAAVPGKASQWKGFVRKAKLTDAPANLTVVIADLAVFLLPVSEAVIAGHDFRRAWRAAGPWL